MNSYDQLTRVVELSQSQACALARLFEGLLSRDGNRRADCADVSEQLSDSLWMARWLKGNVALELRIEEVVSLLGAIVATVSERRLNDEDCRALEAVIFQLSAAPWTPVMVDNVVQMPSAAIVA